MSRFAIRALLFLFGVAPVACEVWGSYDYMIEKYAHWNYLVAGSLVVTSLGAVLPLAAEYARREGSRIWPLVAWACVPLSFIFVFTVAVQRTGGAVDSDEAGRQRIAQAIKIAKAEEGEALAQLTIDKAEVAKNCGVWGPKCDKAKGAQAATESKLSAARIDLKKQGVSVDDSLATRLVALLPFLNKAEIQLYQPMLLPMCLSLLGSIMIGIAAHGRKERKAIPEPAKAEEPKPAPPVQTTPRKTPQLTVVPRNGQPSTFYGVIGELLERAKRARTAIEDLYGAYANRVQPDQRLAPKEFVEKMQAFCAQADIKISLVDDKPCLVGVRLVASR